MNGVNKMAEIHRGIKMRKGDDLLVTTKRLKELKEKGLIGCDI